MSAIAINGSPKKDGHTVRLLAKLGVPVIHLRDGIRPARDAILRAKAIVFGTPVRWFNVSALMKQLIDSLPEAPDYPCHRKIAFFVAVCDEDGGQQAINQMFAPLNHMGFSIPPFASYFYNNNMADKSEERWMLTEASALRSRLRAYI